MAECSSLVRDSRSRSRSSKSLKHKSSPRKATEISSYSDIDVKTWKIITTHGSKYHSIRNKDNAAPIFNFFQAEEWGDIEFGPKSDSIPTFQIRVNAKQVTCMRSINEWLLQQIECMPSSIIGKNYDRSFYKSPLTESDGRWPSKLSVYYKLHGPERFKTVFKKHDQVIESQHEFIKNTKNWKQYQIRVTLCCEAVKFFSNKNGNNMFSLNLIAKCIEFKEKN